MKTWLITGCSSGLGAGIAQAVLEAKDRAVITARNTDMIRHFARQYPDTAMVLPLDVTKPESIELALAEVERRWGSIDVLVNNAGYGYRAAIEEGEPEEVARQFSTNLFGPIALMKKVLPQMRKQGSGVIFNVSSLAANAAYPGSGYYAASKAALASVTEALSRETRHMGIKVIDVEPGSFRTHFFDTSMRGTVSKIEDYEKTVGERRKENIVNLGDQPGDPYRAGKVLVELAHSEKTPRRIMLGSDAVKAVTTILTNRLKEVEEWTPVSRRTDFQ